MHERFSEIRLHLVGTPTGRAAERTDAGDVNVWSQALVFKGDK